MGNTNLAPEVVQLWKSRIAAGRRDRDDSVLVFRELIKSAAEAGLSASQIAEAAKLSTFRIYQIVHDRRT